MTCSSMFSSSTPIEMSRTLHFARSSIFLFHSLFRPTLALFRSNPWTCIEITTFWHFVVVLTPWLFLSFLLHPSANCGKKWHKNAKKLFRSWFHFLSFILWQSLMGFYVIFSVQLVPYFTASFTAIFVVHLVALFVVQRVVVIVLHFFARIITTFVARSVIISVMVFIVLL